MIIELWEWMSYMTKKSTERVLKWSHENRERRREMTNKAVAKYREKHKDDQEYLERKRATERKSSKKYYHKKMDTMTPEELEEHRRRLRERVAKCRAKKKLQEAANEEKGKSPEA